MVKKYQQRKQKQLAARLSGPLNFLLYFSEDPIDCLNYQLGLFFIFHVMRRHSSLIPFSKQHHHILVLAQVLKSDVPDFKGMPTTLEGKIDYINRKFEEIILPNITKHRKSLYPNILNWGFPDSGLIQHIQELEDEILIICKAIREGRDYSEMELSDFGYSLDSLVRIKERELYEMIQVRFAEELNGLEL